MSLKSAFEAGYQEGLEGGGPGGDIWFFITLGYRALKWILWHWLGLGFMILWLACGIITSVTIVGFPYAKTVFVSSVYTLIHSDKAWRAVKVKNNYKKAPVANIVWCCSLGLILSLAYIAMGVLMCSTLIMIPLGISYFKAAKYAFMPFGAELE